MIEIIAPAGLPGRNRVMPYLLLHNFLEESMAASLLEYAVAHESEFAPARVGNRQNLRVDRQFRISVSTRRLPKVGRILRAKLLGLLPEFVAALRSTLVEEANLELELVAHNDGAFYARHIDTATGEDSNQVRVLSGVYYFHAKPKAFTGGALRLFAIHDGPETAFVDVEPEDNSLVIFHSWVPHAVMPVACPSRQFGASRFAINCWIYGDRATIDDPGATKPS